MLVFVFVCVSVCVCVSVSVFVSVSMRVCVCACVDSRLLEFKADADKRLCTRVCAFLRASLCE